MGSSAEVAASADHSLFWRRLHSLSGIVPVGAFLLEHLFINAHAINGPESYNAEVAQIEGLPLILLLEISFIYVPIAFHALYGVWIWLRGTSNLSSYPWAGNRLYALQRWSGLITMVYIGYHVWEQRFAGVAIHASPFITFSKVQHSIVQPAIMAFYVVGLIAACWHFSYGVWLFCCKWGLTPGKTVQAKLRWACAGLFVVLTGAGLLTLYRIASAPLQPAPEQLLQEKSQRAEATGQKTEIHRPAF